MASRAEYNKKKQTESVQFGAGQNNINPVSGGGEEFSSRGVVSMVGDEQKLVQAGIQQGAEGASRLIGDVKEFREGMAIAETSQKYAEAVNAFLPDAERDAQIDRQNEELSDIQSVGDYYEEEAFRTFGDGKTTGDQAIAAISLAADNTKAKLNKERLGHIQGKISEEQFLNRTARITKDAIARHPTLADRFVSDMNHIYEVARVKDHRDDLSDQRKTIAAQLKEANTKTLNLFTARHGFVPINAKTGLPDQALMSTINKQYYDEITSVENTTKKITATTGLSEAEKAAEFNEMLEVSEDGQESELTKYTYGSTSILLDKWQKDIEGLSGKEKDIKITEMRNEMNDVISTAQTTFVSRYGNNETLKNYMSIFISRTDKAITDMENSMNGTQAAKRLKNNNEIYRSREIKNFTNKNNMTPQGLTDILNIINLATESKLYSNMNFNRGVPELGIKPNQGKILSSNLLTMVNQIVNDSIDGINNADPKAPSAALDAINNADAQNANQKVPNEDPDKQQKINNVAVMNSISTIEKMKDRTDQYKATEETLDRFIKNPNTPNLLAKLAPESKDRLEKHYRKFIKTTDDSLKQDIENVRASGMDIKVEFNNGRLSFHSSSNAAEANNLTHRYTGRFEKFTKFMGLLENKNSTDANFLEQNIMRSIPNVREFIEEDVSAPSSPLSSIQTQKEYEYEKATKEYEQEQERQAIKKGEAESEVKKKDTSESVVTSPYVKNNEGSVGEDRNDPTQGKKGKGFAAGNHTVTMDDGEEVQITEYTVGVTIDGKIVDVPSVNSYTTEEDMEAIKESVRTGKPLPQGIEEKAQRHALDRIEAKKSIYLEDGEEQVPFAIDRFGGAKDLSGEVEELKKANIKKHFNNKLVALIKKQEGNPQLIARKLFKDEKYPTSGYGRNN